VVEQIREGESTGRVEVEYRSRCKDGKYRWLSTLIFIEYDAHGKPSYHEGNVRDISATKTAQEVLLRNSALATVGRMTAAIAHEINNPLTAVTNLLFLAQHSDELPEPIKEYLKQADAELQRIARITRRTLSFYRETATPVQVRVETLLASSIDLLQRQVEMRGAQVKTECEPGLEVRVFGGELRQVITNLLSNSLDALGDQGVIRMRARRCIQARRGTPCVRIVVADNGHGIAEEVRAQIFDPFFTTKGNVGTGIGLWVSAQLVEKNGGTIRVRSSRVPHRHGTVFVLDLPL
jgi:signal transduction histidine kinase